MALHTNTLKKVVTYSTPGIFDKSKILENDLDVLNSTGYQEAFNIPLATSERIMFRAYLNFNYHSDGDIKTRIVTPTGTTNFLAIVRESEIPISGDIDESDVNVGPTQYTGTTGTGEIEAAGGSGSGTYYIQVEHGIVETPGSYASDASKALDIQFTQKTASATQATTLLAGSYIEYKKF